jgi:hypothetical protein
LIWLNDESPALTEIRRKLLRSMPRFVTLILNGQNSLNANSSLPWKPLTWQIVCFQHVWLEIERWRGWRGSKTNKGKASVAQNLTKTEEEY